MPNPEAAALPPNEVGRGPSDAATTTNLGNAVYRNAAIVPLMVAITLVLIAFANPIQPPSNERVSAGNPVLLAKLFVAGVAWLIGLWGVLHSVHVRRLLWCVPGVVALAIACVFLVSSVFATGESALISQASALILLGYLLFIATSLNLMGLRRICIALLIGNCCFLLVTWFLYLFVPSIGHFHEYTDSTTTVVRMGGLAHPNAIARESAIALIVCLSLMRGRAREGFADGVITLRQWWVAQTRLGQIGWFTIVTLCVITLLTTLSRTSILAATAGVAMVLFDKLYTRRVLIAGLAGFSLIAGTFLVVGLNSTTRFSDSVTSFLTKSGDLEELTSLTGRTAIWREALQLISDRPLLGYGLDSAPSVMSEESVGTHSLLLHVMFSGGVIAGMLIAILLGLTVYLMLASLEPLYRGISAFVLVSGLVEDTLFESFPDPLTVLWLGMIMSLSLPTALRSLRPSDSARGVSYPTPSRI